VPRTLTILRSTAAALAVAHAAGLVHRDVKPGNVLMARDGTVKITDFGIAWSASSVPLTQTGQVIGTAHYLSPEQAQGAKATPASDVYALGAVAYECLAGRRAFEGENSVQIAVMQIRDHPDPLPRDVPAAVRQLIERAMVKDPADRFHDGAALQDAVDAILAGRASVSRGHTGTAVMPLPVLGAEPDPPSGKPRVPLQAVGRRLAVGAAIGVVAVLALVAVAVGLLGGNPAGPAAGTTTGQPTGQTAEPAAQTTAETPPTIDLVAADFVGRPVADVQAELTALGLVPQLQPVQTADVPEGQVTAVDPLTGLVSGSPVTVSHAVAPPAPPQQSSVDEGNGDGNGSKGNKGNGKGKKDD
jgi:eukaryotic-like serine/threonine-protein kinase